MVWSRLRRYLWQAKRPPLNQDYKCWVKYFLFKMVENCQSRRHLRGSRLLVVGCSLFTQAACSLTPPLPTFCANGDNDDVDDDDIGGWTTLTMTSSPLTSCILTLAGSTSFKRPTGAALFVSLSSRAPGPDDEMKCLVILPDIVGQVTIFDQLSKAPGGEALPSLSPWLYTCTPTSGQHVLVFLVWFSFSSFIPF